MSSERSGLRSLLGLPVLYRWFDAALGGPRMRSAFVAEVARIAPGDKVLDVGCGPGHILEHLPDVDYLGCDTNERYVDEARERYGARGRFVHAGIQDLAEGDVQFDVALSTGVLHHLDDDQARSLFEYAHRALRPGGRLCTLDGCYAPGQHPVARRLLANDRGRYVRTEAAYVALARERFAKVESRVRHDALRIPYTHVFLTCEK